MAKYFITNLALTRKKTFRTTALKGRKYSSIKLSYYAILDKGTGIFLLNSSNIECGRIKKTLKVIKNIIE